MTCIHTDPPSAIALTEWHHVVNPPWEFGASPALYSRTVSDCTLVPNLTGGVAAEVQNVVWSRRPDLRTIIDPVSFPCWRFTTFELLYLYIIILKRFCQDLLVIFTKCRTISPTLLIYDDFLIKEKPYEIRRVLLRSYSFDQFLNSLSLAFGNFFS